MFVASLIELILNFTMDILKKVSTEQNRLKCLVYSSFEFLRKIAHNSIPQLV